MQKLVAQGENLLVLFVKLVCEALGKFLMQLRTVPRGRCMAPASSGRSFDGVTVERSFVLLVNPGCPWRGLGGGRCSPRRPARQRRRRRHQGDLQRLARRGLRCLRRAHQHRPPHTRARDLRQAQLQRLHRVTRRDPGWLLYAHLHPPSVWWAAGLRGQAWSSPFDWSTTRGRPPQCIMHEHMS